MNSRPTSFRRDSFRRSGPSRFRPQYGPSRGGSRSGARPIKKFDPSVFIKKVEEQVVVPEYTPQHSFNDFNIIEQLKNNITNRGYKAPTPIQDQIIPVLLEGKDVIGSANTGTGKTASFLIPLVHAVATKKVSRVLIIAPTRELADQINSELKIFKEHMGIYSTLCIGGLNIVPQMRDLRRNPQFVIGTPGRLKDLERSQAINFSTFGAIVLDEVDTMLDMGFIHDIKYIISKLPQERHSLFFSATISPAIRDIAKIFLKNPVTVSVKTRQSAQNVNQDVVKVNQENKIEILHDLLIKPDLKKTIIFLRTKRAADKLSKKLYERGFKISTIHGNKTQAQRKKALALFKDDKVAVLLATDVVARGIDIDNVSHVINFDLPQTHDDYIHRIGRTGRADKIGHAITFIE